MSLPNRIKDITEINVILIPEAVISSIHVASDVAVMQVDGAAGTSELMVYSKWLSIDGGNPFSHYSVGDELIGGIP